MVHAVGKPLEHVEVPITADLSHLDSNDRQVLILLAEAVRLINPIYLTQMRQNLDETNGLFDNSRGNNFYPEDTTRDELEAYLDEHPDEREALLSNFTVVERDGEHLKAVPYSEFSREHLAQISFLLEEAARFTSHMAFRTFLLSRAQAFRTNQFRDSDIDWVRVVDAPFELTIGPYEEYEDKLFGVKRNFEGILGVVLPEESAEAQVYQQQVTNFDAHLGRKYGYTASTTLTPMVVMDEVVAAGMLWYGFIAAAYNLPNDPDFQQEIGSKKVFMRNTLRTRIEMMTMQIAKRVLHPDLVSLIDPALLLKFVIGHESSHGISFRFDGDDFLNLGSPLEEGKADVFGMIFLHYLAEKGIVKRDVAERAVIGNLTDGLRQIRKDLEAAHAVGTLIQYNWFLKHGAMQFGGNGLEFKPTLFEQTLDGLGDEFYALSQTRDHKAAQQFVDEWGQVPDEVRTMIASFDGIPVDIDPVFEV